MDSVDSDKIQVGENKFVSKSIILSHLKTYNLYYEGEALQLRHREEEGELIIEGLLNVFWGVRRPIRLQMQDEKETSMPRPSLTSLSNETDINTVNKHEKNQPCISIETADDQSKDSGEEKEEMRASRGQHTRIGSAGPGVTSVGGESVDDDLASGESGDTDAPSTDTFITTRQAACFVNCSTRSAVYYSSLLLTNDCVKQTAVFTPAFGSVTNVRINSCMTTTQVMRVLLSKFKIENSPDEFSLYLVHTSGERHQLKPNDHPLAVRVLKGPCEQVSKIFLMETDQVEEVTYDVAQYIKFELPVLQSFVAKLQEEEEREMQKLKKRYADLRRIIKRYMKSLADETT
ncbi:ras association domain-containing protein 2b [Pseudorasbora parva]|uniref:ras association domain-containing protein 2b n=1 Tax=Pseudorasbora parva TaxID=51549 RepID=UPI00351F03EE